MKDYPLVEVSWMDATGEATEVTLDDLPELTLAKTVGRLLKRDAQALWVAAEVLEPSRRVKERRFRDTTVIPVAWVKRVRRLS